MVTPARRFMGTPLNVARRRAWLKGGGVEGCALLLRGFGGGVLLRPLAGGLDGSFLVLLPGFGDFGGERVVGIGCAEEGLDGEEDGADLEGGGPVIYRVGGEDSQTSGWFWKERVSCEGGWVVGW